MRIKPAFCFTGQDGYHQPCPYHPPERYPELGFLPDDLAPDNRIYAGMRSLLHGMGYDAERYGTSDWSPLSDLVKPGGVVVIKPNFVRHYNEDPNGILETVVTHPAVIRPLIDYALKAVGPDGKVMVADAPQYDCEVEVLLERNRLPELLSWYGSALGIAVGFHDLRVQFGIQENGVVKERRDLAGDPEGYEAVDLGSASEFASMPLRELHLLRGADYDHHVTKSHHNRERNAYLVSRTILNADLVINCPKVKTHKKSGVTLSMKNLIGINGDKNWLPHYRAGFSAHGGDEFPRPDLYSRFRRVGAEIGKQMLKRGIGGPIFSRIRRVENASGLGERARNGNWHGNDTIWRTCLDLNKILYLGDRRGELGHEIPRRVLNVYDGIVSGEGNGPMGPTARPIGLLAAGEDPGSLDAVLAWIMGFDWRRIPVLVHATEELQGGVRISHFSGDRASLLVQWIDEQGSRELRFSELDLNLHFAPHECWVGTMERDERSREACAS